jgi:hypothetical protein
MYETTEVASFNNVKIYELKKKLKFAPPLPTMPIQLATLQLATLQLATLQLVTFQLATLTTRHPDNLPL